MRARERRTKVGGGSGDARGRPRFTKGWVPSNLSVILACTAFHCIRKGGVAPVSHLNFSSNLDPLGTRCAFEELSGPSVLSDLSGEKQGVDFSAHLRLQPFNCEKLIALLYVLLIPLGADDGNERRKGREADFRHPESGEKRLLASVPVFHLSRPLYVSFAHFFTFFTVFYTVFIYLEAGISSPKLGNSTTIARTNTLTLRLSALSSLKIELNHGCDTWS